MTLTLIIVLLGAFALVKWTSAELWHVAAAMLAGFLLAGTAIGPQISSTISTLTGGRL